MRQVIVIAHNIRSTHNVGSLLRTADGLGVGKVYLTGYTPYPKNDKDPRLPHLANKISNQIHKTALNAEYTTPWEYSEPVIPIIRSLKNDGFQIYALEQADNATKLQKLIPTDKAALLLGSEVGGIDKKLLTNCDKIVEIPMFGQKESFNVVQAAAMALYQVRFYPFE